MREIGAEGLRAGEIIRRLRQHGAHRRRSKSAHSLDVNALIEELRSLLLADARVYDVRLRHQARRRDLPPVLGQCHPAAAGGAQPGAQCLRSAGRDSGRRSRIVELATARTADGALEIRVSDNGPGIAPAIADRLFEPFTTTKETGTGLGLAISRTIVQAHRRYNRRPQGRSRVAPVFYVRLPVAEESLA